MLITITLGCVSLLFALTIFISFCFSKREKTPENDMFFRMLVVDIVGLLSELFSAYTMLYYEVAPEFNNAAIRFYYIMMSLGIIYIAIFNCFLYNDNLLDKKNERKLIGFFFSLFIIEVLICLFGDISFSVGFDASDRLLVYTNGLVPTSIMIYSGIFFVFLLYYLIRHNSYYFLQRILCFSFFAVVFVINGIFWEFNFIFSSFTIIVMLIYFLIENFDVKKVSQMKNMREKIEKLDNDKNKYLSSMSQEIRTNLNTIVVSSDLLMESNNTEDIRGELKELVYASESLLEIVGNILDLNRIESNKLESIDQVYNLKEEAKSISNMNMVRLENKPVQFVMNIDPTIPDYFIGDKAHIKQVLNNLISNAFKYTNEGSVVLKINGKMDLYKNNVYKLEIEVTDTGIGMKDVNRLFNKFDRLDVDKTSNIEGTGLGLVITKRLVEYIGGELDVTSVYGKGSTFKFIFSQKIADNETEIKNDNYELDYKFNNKRILLVDDNFLNLSVLKRTFDKFNCDVDVCSDGEDALQKISDVHYDVVFTDVLMPGVNGMDILARCKKYRIPTVAITADAVNGSQEKYISEGFAAYIPKPYTSKEIYRELVNILRRK